MSRDTPQRDVPADTPVECDIRGAEDVLVVAEVLVGEALGDDSADVCCRGGSVAADYAAGGPDDEVLDGDALRVAEYPGVLRRRVNVVVAHKVPLTNKSAAEKVVAGIADGFKSFESFEIEIFVEKYGFTKIVCAGIYAVDKLREFGLALD